MYTHIKMNFSSNGNTQANNLIGTRRNYHMGNI